jgi:hypothetical protein
LLFYSSLPCGRAKQIVPALFSKILWDGCVKITNLHPQNWPRSDCSLEPSMKPGESQILTINGGSSSIKFALYAAVKPLKRGLYGTVDRIGLSGTNLTFYEAGGHPACDRWVRAGLTLMLAAAADATATPAPGRLLGSRMVSHGGPFASARTRRVGLREKTDTGKAGQRKTKLL